MTYEEQRMAFWCAVVEEGLRSASGDVDVKTLSDAWLHEFDRRFAPNSKFATESKAADFTQCTHVLKNAGQLYPRTCAVCRLGPCKRIVARG